MGLNRYFIFASLFFTLARCQTESNADEGRNFSGTGLDATTQIKDAVEDVKKLENDWKFLQGFTAAFSMIIISEIGDKTFFIAAIMAMKHARLTVFTGAILALTFMTVLSVAFGWIATVIPRLYTYYISTALLAIFGVKMIRDGLKMSPNEEKQELEEVQSKLKKKEEEWSSKDKKSEDDNVSVLMIATVCKPDGEGDENKSEGTITKEKDIDIEVGETEEKEVTHKMILLFSRVLIQAFTLTLLAEWGDRSQLSTIILAARENIYSVSLGAILGHSICTAIAVLGGRILAQKISIRTVMLIGGFLFLMFACSAIIMNPKDSCMRRNERKHEAQVSMMK